MGNDSYSEAMLGDSPRSRVVIVGAGHGGANAAAFLRQKGFGGEVILIGEEPVMPYQRPPLSKAYIADHMSVEDLYLKPTQFYRDQGIELRLGTRVAEVNPEGKFVSFSDGTTLEYDVLILATGAAPRSLDVPGSDLTGIQELRTIADAGRLRDLIPSSGHLVVVGGGYIGLEVAAVCQTNGVRVTVIEREDRLLARVASVELSKVLTAYHQERGTNILTSDSVVGFAGGADGAVRSVILSDGTEIACGGVLTGIGAVPCDALACGAGLHCDNGIVVDEQSRTSDRWIFAIGDVTRRPLPNRTDLFRMESIPSAVEQAGQAVAAIMGGPQPKPEVPWFWSDQFNLKLKMAGLVHEGEEVIARNSLEGFKIAFFHVRGENVVAVETINSPGEFMAGKRFIEKNARVDLTKLADSSVPLQGVLV
ncbi:NAD(P)/FAD-dependent oxidoreductase [Candidatus Protofrankia californiensis]|uniref:NAD(P)/FAD-dependent oxidoreductase n=1 Tax=Candidatus Protofrankia californiensis TaxID=1839754 RepID=UPI001F494537|nr:FAD-dependent oxidoreductase [Candidatus Protofrankia californiensis]